MDDPFFRRFFGVPEGQQQQQREREVSAAGSGVIVDAAKGYILTNHHVVNDADEIKVFLNDDRAFDAVIVGSDAGKAPWVQIIDAASGAELHRFLAYSSAFRGGVDVALGDVNTLIR